jgi:hypothetical protein
VPLGERFGLQRAAGKLIEAHLHPTYLDGITAHIDRGQTRRALSHPSQVGRRHAKRSSSTYRSASSSAREPDDATPITCDSAAEPKDA